nr:MAG TPA: hypothetical protein [Caudoviricetes sp.]
MLYTPNAGHLYTLTSCNNWRFYKTRFNAIF